MMYIIKIWKSKEDIIQGKMLFQSLAFDNLHFALQQFAEHYDQNRGHIAVVVDTTKPLIIAYINEQGVKIDFD